jgi:histidinol-phosphate/aromatic aminotransferase/cobyric acid decarboxylase-like protein
MLGNGSDELIDLLAVACDKPGATILAPVPGFVMYAMSAQLKGLCFVGVDLTPEFELAEGAMLTVPIARVVGQAEPLNVGEPPKPLKVSVNVPTESISAP